MKISLLLALKNIKRYKLNAISRSILLFFFSFVIISALMFSMSISMSISDILRTRLSGTNIIIKTDRDNIHEIIKSPFISEAVLCPTNLFVSGSAEIENLQSFHINSYINIGQNIKSLIPDTHLEEFKHISEDNFILEGRLPQNNNELIIDSTYLDKIQINDYSEIIGKKISLYYSYLDDIIYEINSAYIVGVYSGEFLNITAYNSFSDTAYCFLLDDTRPYSGSVIAFCPYDKINNATRYFQDRYGKSNIVVNTFTTFALDEFIKISKFINKIMFLASIVISMVFIVIQIIMITHYLYEKQPFLFAINAFGLKKGKISFAFVFEYLILAIIPFSLSCGLAVVFTKKLMHYVSVLAGLTFTVSISIIPIIISFFIVFFTSVIVILLSVYVLKIKRNE